MAVILIVPLVGELSHWTQQRKKDEVNLLLNRELKSAHTVDEVSSSLNQRHFEFSYDRKENAIYARKRNTSFEILGVANVAAMIKFNRKGTMNCYTVRNTYIMP